jgi:hypothetical protein
MAAALDSIARDVERLAAAAAAAQEQQIEGVAYSPLCAVCALAERAWVDQLILSGRTANELRAALREHGIEFIAARRISQHREYHVYRALRQLNLGEEPVYSYIGAKAPNPDDFGSAPERLQALKLRLLTEYREARERRDQHGRHDVHAALSALSLMIKIEQTWHSAEVRAAPGFTRDVEKLEDVLEADTIRELETSRQHRRINGSAQQTDAPAAEPSSDDDDG